MADDDVDAGYASFPTSGDLLGKAYEHQNRDRAAILKVLQKEHYLIPGTNLSEHGRLLTGSAISYIGTSAPTLRPSDGVHTPVALSAADDGRLWLDTTNATFPILKSYKYGRSPAWIETDLQNVYVDAASSKAVHPLSDILDQELKQANEVKFAKVTATGSYAFVGDLEGKAKKIRTADPGSYAAGDIWVE